ncbi:MAG: Smr/MutS family protein [Parvibaculaceae bacterium]|nr:Smr/MutS family protein [Parvibaculaceae bacterium]
MSKRRRSRTLSPEEKSLWRTVASSTIPRAGRSLEKSLAQSFTEAMDLVKDMDPDAEMSLVAPTQKSNSKRLTKALGKEAAARPSVAPRRLPEEMRPLRAKVGRAKVPPPLTGLDRKLEQKLARGKMEPDTKIDLHGHTRVSAEETLYQFLTNARGRGQRCALVVTGKGDTGMAQHTLHGREYYHTPERRTVLREALTGWMHESRFRALVAGFQPAHPRHGGGGAFYVWLRRIR